MNMNSYTTWYPADEPAESMHPQQLRPGHRAQSHESPPEHRQNTSNMPFRLVAPVTNTPYPIHDSQPSTEQQHMVDLITGQRFQRTDTIRQPVAADFILSHRPLPASPLLRHNSDQDLSVTEPDSYFPEFDADSRRHKRVQSADAAHPPRRDSLASPKPLHAVKSDPDQQRPVSVAAVQTIEADDNEVEDKAVPAPAMEPDMFSPALGGLNRLESAPMRRPSRLGRLKRFLSYKGRREYGRAAR